MLSLKLRNFWYVIVLFFVNELIPNNDLVSYVLVLSNNLSEAAKLLQKHRQEFEGKTRKDFLTKLANVNKSYDPGYILADKRYGSLEIKELEKIIKNNFDSVDKAFEDIERAREIEQVDYDQLSSRLYGAAANDLLNLMYVYHANNRRNEQRELAFIDSFLALEQRLVALEKRIIRPASEWDEPLREETRTSPVESELLKLARNLLSTARNTRIKIEKSEVVADLENALRAINAIDKNFDDLRNKVSQKDVDEFNSIIQDFDNVKVWMQRKINFLKQEKAQQSSLESIDVVKETSESTALQLKLIEYMKVLSFFQQQLDFVLSIKVYLSSFEQIESSQNIFKNFNGVIRVSAIALEKVDNNGKAKLSLEFKLNKLTPFNQAVDTLVVLLGDNKTQLTKTHSLLVELLESENAIIAELIISNIGLYNDISQKLLPSTSSNLRNQIKAINASDDNVVAKSKKIAELLRTEQLQYLDSCRDYIENLLDLNNRLYEKINNFRSKELVDFSLEKTSDSFFKQISELSADIEKYLNTYDLFITELSEEGIKYIYSSLEIIKAYIGADALLIDQKLEKLKKTGLKDQALEKLFAFIYEIRAALDNDFKAITRTLLSNYNKSNIVERTKIVLQTGDYSAPRFSRVDLHAKSATIGRLRKEQISAIKI